MILAVNISACSSSQKNDASPTPTATEAVILEETTEPTPDIIEYANDKVVNQFISDYNAISQSPFTDIKKGNIRTKYFAYSYGYYCELLNSTDTKKIGVTISETNDNADIGVSGMRGIFHDVVITIDSELTDDEIYTFFDELVKNEHMTDSTLGTMNINFVPDLELSNGHSRGHIKIEAQ